MKSVKTLAASFALAGCMLPGIAQAQFDTGPAPKPAWEQFKLNSKTTVTLNFKNSNIDMVVQFLSKASGITIVKDPNFKDAITVTTPKPVSLKEAFSIVDTVLGLKGYGIQKSGDIMVIKPKGQASPRMPFNPQASQPQDVLKVYVIKYANATSVATIINEVFTGNGAPNPRNQNPFAFFQFNGGQQQPQTPTGPGVAKASSDDFSNSVIVNADQKTQDQVKQIIDQIDKQTDQPIVSKVFHLKYANATDIASTVQNVLTSQAPKGKGGEGQTNISPQQRFQAAFRLGSLDAAFGSVVADDRSNSLVVSGTEDNIKAVTEVIKELDQPIPIQDTTFVYTLKNARADKIATLFQQSYGNRTGVSGGGFNANANQRQGLSINPSTSGSGGSTIRPGAQNLDPSQPQLASTDPTSLALAMQDPNSTSGALLTSIGVQRGGGGGGFFQRLFGGGNSQNNDLTPSRDASGQLINTRDLAGKVSVIPDINTNSLIIVAPPEDMPLIKSILDQLDQLPQQVVIETIIVEASLDNSDQFGLEWKYAQQSILGDPSKNSVGQTDFGLQTATPLPQGFRYTLTGGDFSAFFNALKKDTKFKVLSTPRIFTSNNVESQINISQRIPYITSQRQDALGNFTYSYSFEDVGILLTVVPRITANGYVNMDIDQQASDLQGYTSFNAPIVNQREANTSVSVKNGNTVILGGIIRNQITATTNKIPLLGDIPILGNLFRSTTKDNQKTELLVFLTPHIINDDQDAAKYRDDTIKQMSPSTGADIKSVLKQPVIPDTPETKNKG